MANRSFQQFFFNLNHACTYLEGNVVIDSGATGKTRSQKGSGIKAVTAVATGVYKIQLENSYARYLGGASGFASPSTGSPIAVGAINPTTVYMIAVVGTTNWQTCGLPAGITPAVGATFVCAATGTGTGYAIAVGTSGITAVEVVGDPNQTITNYTDPHFYIQTLGATSSSVTTLVPTAPADGSVMGFTIFLRNSSLTGKGE